MTQWHFADMAWMMGWCPTIAHFYFSQDLWRLFPSSLYTSGYSLLQIHRFVAVQNCSVSHATITVKQSIIYLFFTSFISLIDHTYVSSDTVGSILHLTLGIKEQRIENAPKHEVLLWPLKLERYSIIEARKVKIKVKLFVLFLYLITYLLITKHNISIHFQFALSFELLYSLYFTLLLHFSHACDKNGFMPSNHQLITSWNEHTRKSTEDWRGVHQWNHIFPVVRQEVSWTPMTESSS